MKRIFIMALVCFFTGMLISSCSDNIDLVGTRWVNEQTDIYPMILVFVTENTVAFTVTEYGNGHSVTKSFLGSYSYSSSGISLSVDGGYKYGVVEASGSIDGNIMKLTVPSYYNEAWTFIKK